MNRPIPIADAIVSAINDSGLLGSATAVRSLRVPEYDAAKDLNELVATVVPRLHVKSIQTRGTKETQPRIDVAIQKRISNEADQDAAIEELTNLLDTISDLFLGERLTNESLGVSVVCITAVHDPWIESDHLKNKNVVTTVAQLTFLGTP